MMTTKQILAISIAVVFISVGAAYYLRSVSRMSLPPPQKGEPYSYKSIDILSTLNLDRNPDPFNMGSVEGTPKTHMQRQIRSIEEVDRLSTEETFSVLLNAFNDKDDDVLNIAQDSLIKRAHKGDDRGSQKIRKLYRGVPGATQRYFVWLLGEMATPGALEALIGIAKVKDPQYTTALQEIEKIGEHLDENRKGLGFRTELSPLLEKELHTALGDRNYLKAIAGGLSTIGSDGGVNALLQTLEKAPGQMETEIIATAMTKIRNPEAIPPLAAQLEQDPELLDSVSLIAGNTLAAIGKPQATHKLLLWAAEAKGQHERDQAIKWLSQVGDEASLNLMLESGQRYTFRDPEMQKNIIELAQRLDREW